MSPATYSTAPPIFARNSAKRPACPKQTHVCCVERCLTSALPMNPPPPVITILIINGSATSSMEVRLQAAYDFGRMLRPLALQLHALDPQHAIAREHVDARAGNNALDLAGDAADVTTRRALDLRRPD